MGFTTDEKINFIADLYCPARVIADETGCSWEMLLAQAALESDWGNKCLPGSFNVYNIKADKRWKGPSRVYHVTETVNHHTVWVDDAFRVYPSYLASLQDRAKFVQENPRYAPLREPGVKGNYKEEAKALKKAGYATDDKYVKRLIDVVECGMMKKAVARAQARGCAAVLPLLEVVLFDGAKVPIAGTPVKLRQDGRDAQVETDASGRFVIRITPNSGDVQLKVFDKYQDKWIPLDPIAIAKPAVSRNVTLLAPTFTAHTNTREHEKTSPPKPATKPTGGEAPTHHPGIAAIPAGAKLKKVKVAKGDSLARIAANNGVRYQTLAKLNGITSPYIIRPEQELLVPILDKAPKAGPAKPAVVAPHTAPGAAAGSVAAKKGVAGVEHAELARILADGSPALHTVYGRNAQSHPQTDLMHATRAPWMALAQTEFEKGVRRRPGAQNNDPRILEYFTATPSLPRSFAAVDETAYCAAFANWCMGRAGYRGSNSAGALSLRHWGRSTRGNKPAFGAVAVIQFPGGPHVTFVAGISPDGTRIATLGGNQGHHHEVSHSYCPMTYVLAFRYPANYPDYDEDYVLHDVASDSAPMNAASTH